MRPSFSQTVTVRAFLWNIRASAEGDMSYVLPIHFSIDCGLFSLMRVPPKLLFSALRLAFVHPWTGRKRRTKSAQCDQSGTPHSLALGLPALKYRREFSKA